MKSFSLFLALGMLLLSHEYVQGGGGGGSQLSPLIRVDTKSSSPTTAIIEDRGVVYSADLRIFPSTNHQSETSIAINPCNVVNMLVGANTDPGQGYYFTVNSGSSWSGGDVLPGVGLFSSDPAIAYDAYNIGNPNGYANGYFNYLEDVGSGYRVFVKKTTNGGATWLGAVQVPDNQDYLDKNHMVADITSSVYRNNLYTAYTRFSSIYIDSVPDSIRFTRSMNRGSSFSNPVIISGSATGLFSQGVNLAVGPNGEVYAVWAIADNWGSGQYGSDGIGFAKSLDGGANWQAASRILNIQGSRDFWTDKNPDSVNGPIRMNDFPVIAVDRSGGPYNGTLYLVFGNKGAGADRADIQFSKSTNGGTNWTTPVRVNNDNTTYDQWFPWITVSPFGRISIIFYDSRNDNVPPVNQATEVWLAESTNGGQTFSNSRVSDIAFTPYPILGNAYGYMGDYIGIASKAGIAYPCWMDNRTGWYQTYVDFIDTYQADLLMLASQNRSPFAFATANGSSPKTVYADNKWHRLVQENEYIAYASSADDGLSWTSHQLVNGSALGWLSNPSLWFNGGKLHSVFKTDGNSIYYLRGTTAGVWEQPRLLFSVSGQITGIASVVDAAGIGHVAYTYSSSGPTGNNYLDYGTFNTLDAAPILANIVSLVSSVGSLESPTIAVESNNLPHVAWKSGGDIYHRNKTGTSWSSMTNVSNTSTTSEAPSICIVNNTLHVVWQENLTGNTEIYYVSRSGGGVWGSTLNLSNNSSGSVEPFVCGPVNGEPLVVWADSAAGNYDIKYKFPVSGASGSFASTAAQSHFPTFGSRAIFDGTRVLLSCTDGSSALYLVANDKKDFSNMAQGKIAVGSEGENKRLEISRSFALFDNHPNPFNPSTTIKFALPEPAVVSLTIYDVLGRKVAELANGQFAAGDHSAIWNASEAASGVYIAQLVAYDALGNVRYSRTNKLALMK